jgi:tetratricopeptide (TPR) repeat protein
MKKGLFYAFATVVCCTSISFGQGTQDESIRQFITTERKAAFDRDTTAYFALLSKDPDFSVTFSGNGYYNVYSAKDFRAALTQAYKQPQTGKRNPSQVSNLKARNFGDHAIAEFVNTSMDSTNKPVRRTLETWTLSKDQNAWKIDKIFSIDTASFNPYTVMRDEALEQEINTVGYRLLTAKKNEQAIRIFKMNVEMFPKSWNVYDSLGEAYMLHGNKKEAIANYAISIKLNPENTNGKAFLEKLKNGK